jgi:deoxyadenosine/deoxycytidine kinase
VFKRLIARLLGRSREVELELAEQFRTEFREHRSRIESLIHEVGLHREDIANEMIDLEQEDDKLSTVQDEIEAFLG